MNSPIHTDELLRWQIGLRRHFHKYPEVSFREYKTQEYIMSVLDGLGIENRKIADTGVLGIIQGKNEGKTIALRADMDALSIDELPSEHNGSYISEIAGIMHACGHDAHMAILLGAAKIFKHNEDSLHGRVKLIFQPAEETPPGGSIKVIGEGILEDVDSIIGMHLFTHIPLGEIHLKRGILMASNCKFDICISGKSGHHSKPDSCIDPIQIASDFISTIQTDLGKTIPPEVEYVLGFGTISGGKQFNQTPSEVHISGSFRVLGEEKNHLLIEQCIRKNLDDLMESHKGSGGESIPTYSLKIIPGYPSLVNTPKFTEKSADLLRKEEYDVKENIEPVFASEDFSRYLQKIPGIYLFLGAGNTQKGLIHGNHSNRFDIDESILTKGAHIMYSLANDFLNFPEQYL